MLKEWIGRLIGPLFFDYYENADGTRLRIIPKSKWAREFLVSKYGTSYREVNLRSGKWHP